MGKKKEEGLCCPGSWGGFGEKVDSGIWQGPIWISHGRNGLFC